MSWIEQSLTEINNKLNTMFHDKNDSNLKSAMAYSCLNGGKRLRPLLTIAAGQTSNAQNTHLYSMGIAIELIHCYSLVHDDLPAMDNDDLRRGIPTCHIKYGDAMAILVGDALQSLAFAIISSDELNLPPSTQLKLINILANASGELGMVGGQALDILNTNKTLTVEELSQMHALKTGALIKAAILCGYLLGENANKNDEIYLILDNIANKIGLLYQVIDDILDYTGDTKTLGKTANKDEAQQKATFINLYGLTQSQEFADTLYKEIVDSLFKLPNHAYLLDLLNMIFNRKN